MLNIIAILIYLGVVFWVFRLVLKGRDHSAITKKSIILTLLRGALPCTVCIVIFELSFDRFILKSSGSLSDEILTSFFRAALIEEGFKYVFSRAALKKYVPSTKLESMLLCGLIGTGYGLVEKLVIGGGVILIVNAFLPLHAFFQFFMGALLFDAREAGEAGNRSLQRKKLLLSFLLPFAVHGLWDSLLATAGWFMEMDTFAGNMIGLLLFVILIAGGIILECKAVKRMRKMP